MGGGRDCPQLADYGQSDDAWPTDANDAHRDERWLSSLKRSVTIPEHEYSLLRIKPCSSTRRSLRRRKINKRSGGQRFFCGVIVDKDCLHAWSDGDAA